MPAKVPMIPIKKDADAHYRYKMPRITSRTQSAGNGIKTSILNGPAVAKAIGRPTSYITQWYTYAFGVQAKQSKKTTNEMILLNGSHDPKKLLSSLYEFIDNFVMCPACGNPETTLEKKNNTLFFHCHSCGNESQCVVSKSSNYFQKMYEYILSHITQETINASNVTTQIPKKGSETVEEFPKQGAVPTGQGVYINTEELEGILKKLEPLKYNQQTKTVSEEEIEEFFEGLKTRCNSDEEDQKIYTDLMEFAQKMNSNDSSKLLMAFQAIIDGHVNDLIDVINKRKALLILLTMKEETQRDLLCLTSQYITQTHPELFTSAPIIWYTLYDDEIVEIPALQAWYKKPSSRFEKDQVKAGNLRTVILAPFYEWLEKAEFEEVIEAPKEVIVKEEEEAPKDEEEDIDIDNI